MAKRYRSTRSGHEVARPELDWRQVRPSPQPDGPLPRPNIHEVLDMLEGALLGHEAQHVEWAMEPVVQEHQVAAVLHEFARWYSATYPECGGCGHHPHITRCETAGSDRVRCTCPTGWLVKQEVEWE